MVSTALFLLLSAGITISSAFHHNVQTRNQSQSLCKSENVVSVSRSKKLSQKIRVPSHRVSKSFLSSSARHYVVVFDIDQALCHGKSIYNEESARELVSTQKKLPECPTIYYTHGYYGKSAWMFIPHLQILFDYLMEQGARIVFFSSAIEERNSAVIPELLTSFWGDEKFQTLKLEGQFDIFSKEDMRRSDPLIKAEWGDYVKDLNVVIRDGESLSDVILVEDDTSYTAHDQQPCIQVPKIFFQSFSDYGKNDYHFNDSFPINNVYYMIGLFKTYFERKVRRKLPLRVGFKRILPADSVKRQFRPYFVESPFVRNTIDMGLAEVRKQVANAKFYQ